MIHRSVDMYVVYLTIYRGNKLPPFYIGYVNKDRIFKGYRGSVGSREYSTIWKQELKTNPNAFKTIILKEYSTKEEALKKESYLQKSVKAHKNPLYINRAISNEKFFGGSHPGRKMSAETKNKLSELTKAQFSNEIYKKKHYDSCKDNNASHSGTIWINDGISNKRVDKLIFETKFKNLGWIEGRYFKDKENAFWNYDKTGSKNPFFGRKHTKETKNK